MYSTVDSGLTITSTGSGVRPDEGNADESVVSLLFNAAIRRSGFVKYSPVKLLIQASSPYAWSKFGRATILSTYLFSLLTVFPIAANRRGA